MRFPLAPSASLKGCDQHPALKTVPSFRRKLWAGSWREDVEQTSERGQEGPDVGLIKSTKFRPVVSQTPSPKVRENARLPNAIRPCGSTKHTGCSIDSRRPWSSGDALVPKLGAGIYGVPINTRSANGLPQSVRRHYERSSGRAAEPHTQGLTRVRRGLRIDRALMCYKPWVLGREAALRKTRPSQPTD